LQKIQKNCRTIGLKQGPQASLARHSLRLSPATVAVLATLAARFGGPFTVIGEVAAGGLATLVACAGRAFAVVGEVTRVGFLGAATLSGSLLVTSHVVSPCAVMVGRMNLCHA
jgi:hypothetical protein